jgi:hypothetical protein
MKSNKLMSVIVIVIIVAVVAGGGYYAYHYETTGTVKVSAADAPPTIPGVLDVNVTFSAIALHSVNASSNSTGWTNYSLHDKTIDILKFNTSNAAFLSNLSIHAGSYNMMKIYIKNVSVDIVNVVNANFNLAHAFVLVVFVPPVTVSAHATTSIVTDFNLANNINISTKTINMSASVIIN